MADTVFGVNHPLAVSVWSKKLDHEAFRQTYIGRFIGSDSTSLIQEKTDLKKSAGDNLTCGLRVQLQGDGILGDATLEGNEESMQFYDDKVIVDQLRHAVDRGGRMTLKRVPYDLRNECMIGLADWWAQRMDVAFANHICGYTAETRLKYTGNNPVTAPTTNRILRAGGQANDQSLTSADTITLEMLDAMRVKAETASIKDNTGPLVRPIRWQGNDMYVVFLHDYQVYDLRTNAGTLQWADIQKAAMAGGDVENNPIFTGALGVYNGMVLHKWSRITNGVSSADGSAVTTARRAVLCGAQSATIAFGGENGVNRFTWVEKSFDYENKLGVSAGSIFGLKKTKFTPADNSTTNAEDFGTVVLSTYAVAPTLS